MFGHGLGQLRCANTLLKHTQFLLIRELVTINNSLIKLLSKKVSFQVDYLVEVQLIPQLLDLQNDCHTLIGPEFSKNN